ncbi:ATP-binding protein cassette, subfamily D (ALD), member 2 [Angomonas deanei]|nr:ATP-binding protein cassette, subfamily D (ALD), member 2 [Angomonas deanei]|eukprot:EPY33929.1 ATP-binding protein cassette, subfamily D (ALD), member 2 [Angomonas deanei]
MQELYFRENMMRYFSSRYLSDKVFFRLAGLHQIDNVDHRLTEDITHWSRVASVLYPAVLRPLTEATAFTLMMSRIAGWKTCGLIYSYYLSVALVVSFTTPNINWLTDQRLEKESAFRSGHQQVISYGEELCISAGQNFSQESLTNVFTNVTNQARLASFLFGRYNMLEVFLSKYCSVLLGYLVGAVSLDHLKKKSVDRGGDGSLSSLSGTFSEAGYSFQILAKAIGRLLWNIKLMLLVTGYSSRIMHLDDALEIAEFEAFRQNQQIALSPRASVLTMNASLETSCCQSGGEEHFGRVIRGEHIEFVDVPLVLPTGEVLCPSLSFYVKPGMNLLIMGPNGCGKSSTFRLLGELWPLQDGQVIKPEQEQIYYVPQRPYMYDGTLFEQIIYPLKKKEVNVSESDLYSYLEMAGLESILGRLNVTWDSRLSWNDDTLSLGEKQRLAMARLFFHRPRFAILDECSSLVDLNVEEQLYTHCHNLGITLITIAHRRSVWRHHNYILKFDGLGGYVFAPLRFEENNTQLVLDGIISASKRDDVGQTLKLSVSDPQLGEDEEPAPEL